MEKVIRIGTRGSALALWQAHYVADLLKENHIPSQIIPIETKGDKILDTTIAKIGSKGVFTEEIEEKLRNKEIDIAVHSAKDLQSDLADDLDIVAFCKREKTNDVVLSLDTSFRMDSEAEVLIGTSSTKRTALLKHYFPKVQTINIRGNLQTRFRKLEEGHCQALMLAYAGVYRMGFEQYIVDILPTDMFTPATGQGSVAVEVSRHLDADIYQSLKTILNHAETEICIKAERAFLKKLNGGCSVPVFCLAELRHGHIHIQGGVVSLDGKTIIRHKQIGKSADAESIGLHLAQMVLQSGGDRLLASIKSSVY